MSNAHSNVFAVGSSKILMFEKHLAAWSGGKPGVPVTLEIHPSERCNHKCPDCQAQFAVSKKEMRTRAALGAELDLAWLDSVWEQPPQGIIISGNTGDPLMHPRIGDLLELVASKRIPMVLITNGEALTPELARLAVRVCRGIRISLDAADAGMFLRTHGVRAESWQRVTASVKLLADTRTALGLSVEDCLMGAGYLVDGRTQPGMVAAARLAKSLGADYIQFRPYHTRATDIETEVQACAALEGDGFRVFASQQKYSLLKRPGRSYTQCHGAYFFTVLDARGDLYICCHHVGNPAAQLGNLREQSWSEWLGSQERRRIDAFSVSGCLPFCRLHVHNEALQAMQDGREILAPELTDEQRRHAAFL